MILVHRHTFPIRDVIEMLLDASPEADRWQMRVEGDELVVTVATEHAHRIATFDHPGDGGVGAHAGDIACRPQTQKSPPAWGS